MKIQPPLVPILVIKNEEIWIARVVSALATVFPAIIITDTGSTDHTVEEIQRLDVPADIHLVRHDNLPPSEIGPARQAMQDIAKRLYGAERVFLVDGDELYPTKYLRFIANNPMPADAPGGFTSGVEATELQNGECWLFDVGCNRHAVFSVDSKWNGSYPFESPDSYIPGDPRNHYWPSPDPSYRFYHIHQMRRSWKDEDVFMRKQKQYQFGLADHPEIKPARFWLANQMDYVDGN